jgi:hypothetical protein
LPGFLVHLNAAVTCSHSGVATPMTTIPNVLVMTQPIVVSPVPYAIAGCVLPIPPAANGPCVTGTWLTFALRVFSYGNPVVLQDSMSVCAPSGTPMLIETTQTRVFGM